MHSDTGSIPLPPPSHIGAVVKDLDKTAEFLSSMWGLGPWDTEEYSPSKDDLMVGEPFKLKLAYAKLGPVQLELLQPLDNKSFHAQSIETRGEGVHHIAFVVPNWDEIVSKLKEQGCRMVAGGLYHGKRWAYFDIRPGGIVVEFMELGSE